MKVRALPALDVYIEEGLAVVMVGDQVLLLSELATTAYTAISTSASPLDVDALSSLLLARYGPPEAGIALDSAVQETVRTLERAGLVDLSVDEPASS